MLRFNEFKLSKLNEDRSKIEIDLRNFYIYFIVYPSPVGVSLDNEQVSSKMNLYVGIKNTQSEQPANYFFGSIRSNGPGKSNTFQESANFFRDNMFHIENGVEQKTKSFIYMSSAIDSQPESLSQAYVLGMYHQKKGYHPLICNETVWKNVNKKTGSGLIDKLLNVMKSFFSGTSTKNESFFAEESPSLLKGTNFFPLSLFKKQKDGSDHLKFAQSSDYGYSVFVCDDMNLYVQKIEEILEKTKDMNLPAKEALKQEKEDYDSPEKIEEHIDEVADSLVRRQFQTIKKVFKDEFFKTEREYHDFLCKEIDENRTACLVQRSEKTMQDKLKKTGELFQAANAGDAVLKDSVFKKHYLPHDWSTEARNKALALFKGAGRKESGYEEEKKKRKLGPETYSLDELISETEFKEAIKESSITNRKRAMLNFTAADNVKAYVEGNREKRNPKSIRYCGYKNENGVGSYFWNDKNNLLKKAYEQNDEEAKKQLKKIFEKQDLHLMLYTGRGQKSQKLWMLGITITKRNEDGVKTPYFVVKENNRLVEKEAEKVVKGFGGWRESRKKIMFNLLDFVDMLGYTGVNEDDTLFDFAKKAKLINEEYDEMIEERARPMPKMSELLRRREGVTNKDALKTQKAKKVEIKPDKSKEEKKKEGEEAKSKLKAKGLEVSRTKFRKSKQKQEYDVLALEFIESLLTGKIKFQNIFFDKENAVESVNMKELKEILTEPVEKMLSEEYQEKDIEDSNQEPKSLKNKTKLLKRFNES